MIGGLIRFFPIFVLFSIGYSLILSPTERIYTLADLPEFFEGKVFLNKTCSGNVSLFYDGNVVNIKHRDFDLGEVVLYSELFNFSIAREPGNHTITVVSDCFPEESIQYSVITEIPVRYSYNTNKLMVGDEFRLNVYGQSVKIIFNNTSIFNNTFSKIFYKPGTYTLKIVVSDEYGDVGTENIQIYVSDRFFFNYSFNKTVAPGSFLNITYSLTDFFGRDLTRKLAVRVLGKQFNSNGTLLIRIPEDLPPGNYSIIFSYKHFLKKEQFFVPSVLSYLALEPDHHTLTKNEPVSIKIIALDQTGAQMSLSCELSLCYKRNCSVRKVITTEQPILSDLFYFPGTHTITLKCSNKEVTDELFVYTVENITYNYSTENETTILKIKNTGNVPVNTTVSYCTEEGCSSIPLSLKENQSREIKIRNARNLSLSYKNKTIKIPLSGGFITPFIDKVNWLWLVFGSVLVIVLILLFRK